MSLSLHGKDRPRLPRGGDSEYIARGGQATGRAAQWHAPPVDNHAPGGGGPALAGHPSQAAGSDIEMLAQRYWEKNEQPEALAFDVLV